jgi:hypothetical protein
MFFYKKKECCYYLTSETCVELSERALIFGRATSHIYTQLIVQCMSYESRIPFFLCAVIFYRARGEMYRHRVASEVIVGYSLQKQQSTGKQHKHNNQQANNTGTSTLLTTFLQQKFFRHSGPPNQQNQQKHGSFNDGRCHCKLPQSYST